MGLAPWRRLGLAASLLLVGMAAAPAARAFVPTPPANDNFANAQTLFGDPVTLSANNSGATTEAGEPDPLSTAVGSTVWYRWTAGRTGLVEFNICGEPFLAGGELDVFTGTTLTSLTALSGNSTSGACVASGGSLDSAEVAVTAGTTYYVRVGGLPYDMAGDTGTGAFTLRIDPVPLNDASSSPLTLNFQPLGSSSDFGNFPGENLFATAEPGENDHGLVPPSHSVWFDFQAPVTATYTWTTCDSSFDTTFGVETTGGTVLGGSDDTPAFCPSQPTASALQFSATAGTHYRLVVDGKNGGEGRFMLNGPPVDDDLSPSLPAGSLIGTLFDLDSSGALPFSTTLATHAAGEPSHAGQPASHSVWFQMDPSVDEKEIISSCGSDFDTTLDVYADSDKTTSLASNDDFAGCRTANKHASMVVLNLTASTLYDVILDGAGGAAGTAGVSAQRVAGNDNFANAATITPPAAVAPQALAAATDIGETAEASEPAHSGNTAVHSLWYTYTPAGDGPVTLTTCGSGYDTVLAVYTGSAVDSLTPVASNDDTSVCGNGTNSAVTFQAAGGTPYKIAVDGKNGALGFGLLNVNPPANDSFSAPIDLGALVGQTVAFAPTGGSYQQGELGPFGVPTSSTLWYTWTAPADGQAAIDNTCKTSAAPVFMYPAVWTGTSVDALTLVASPTPSQLCTSISSAATTSWTAHAGTTYRIQISSTSGAQAPGQFRLSFTPSPGGGGGDNGGGTTTTTTPTTTTGSGTTTTTTGTGTPGLPGAAESALTFAGLTVPARGRIADLLGKGLAVRVACVRACAAQAALTITVPLAKKLHLAKVVTMASGRAARTTAGTLVIRLKALAKLAKKLRAVKSLKGTVVVTGGAAGAKPETLTKPISLKR